MSHKQWYAFSLLLYSEDCVLLISVINSRLLFIDNCPDSVYLHKVPILLAWVVTSQKWPTLDEEFTLWNLHRDAGPIISVTAAVTSTSPVMNCQRRCSSVLRCQLPNQWPPPIYNSNVHAHTYTTILQPFPYLLADLQLHLKYLYLYSWPSTYVTFLTLPTIPQLPYLTFHTLPFGSDNRTA